MKDALGHGSDARGDSSTRTQSGRQMFSKPPSSGDAKQLSAMTAAFSAFAGAINGGQSVAVAHAAATLAANHPKSNLVDKHPAHQYSKEAVDNAIASSNRHGRKIGGKEAAAIHRLLKGRR